MRPVQHTRVVCVVDGNGTDEAAVREACALAGHRGHVSLVSVLDPAAADDLALVASHALERGMWQARRARVRASAYLLRHEDVPGLLRVASADALVDLVAR